MKSFIKQKSIIFSVIFFLICCFIVVFLYKNIIDNRENAKVVEQQWQEESSRRENAKSLVDSIKTVESEKAILESHFVQSSKTAPFLDAIVAPFLDTIEKLSNEVGIKTEVISVDSPKESTSLVVSIKSTGSFENVYKLIMLLENSPYDLEFVSVDLENVNAGNSSKTPQWTANLEIRLLSFIN